MRILILSQYFAPEPIPKPTELAEELAKRGHDVTVITGVPNYPTGKIYPGYRLGLIQRHEHCGIPVIRTFEVPYHGKRAIGRIINYLSFMCSAPLAALRSRQWDVIYVWHPPLTVGVAAWIISRLRGVPFVYDVQDIWPESAILVGVLKDGWLVRILRRLERFVYRKASHILVVTEGARANLLEKRVPEERLSVMPHWIDDEPFADARQARQAVRLAHGWNDRFVMMFAGNLGLAQGLDTLVDAVAAIDPELSILLCLVGDGTDRARVVALVETRGLTDRVQFIDRQPQSAMPPLLCAADLVLVHLKRSSISHLVVPTKTLAYLAAGTPILMAMEGAAAELVRRSGAGTVIQPEDSAAMSAAMVSLMQKPVAMREAMGQRGRDFVKATLTRRVVIPQYEALLKAVALKAVPLKAVVSKEYF